MILVEKDNRPWVQRKINYYTENNTNAEFQNQYLMLVEPMRSILPGGLGYTGKPPLSR